MICRFCQVPMLQEEAYYFKLGKHVNIPFCADCFEGFAILADRRRNPELTSNAYSGSYITGSGSWYDWGNQVPVSGLYKNPANEVLLQATGVINSVNNTKVTYAANTKLNKSPFCATATINTS